MPNVNQTYKFNRSFSGTDTVAFILLPGCSPVVIGSLTTVSYSMFRNKKPVINIGRTNINGVTRGSRIFAGTMVFTLINQHWVRELIDQAAVKDWLGQVENLQTDELPLFDIMIVSANEYGAWCSMYIWGIDVTDESQTISVQDLFTENVFQFVARDVSVFKAGDINPLATKKESTYTVSSGVTSRFYILNTSAATLDDVTRYEREYQYVSRLASEYTRQKIYKNLNRTLYETHNERMRGIDVVEIQNLLNASERLKEFLPVNGVFDNNMDKAVREYQGAIGMVPDGIVTDRLYQYLLYDVEYSGKNKYTWSEFNSIYTMDKIKNPGEIDLTADNSDRYSGEYDVYGNSFRGYVVNKFGAYIYQEPKLASNIVGTLGYQDTVRLYESYANPDNTSERFYRVKEGFIYALDVLGPDQLTSIVELPRLEYGQSNAFVRLVEQALAILFPLQPIIHNGIYDIIERDLIKQLQEANGLVPTGIVDNDTWRLLQELSGQISNFIEDDNFQLHFNREPGKYNVTSGTLLDAFNDMILQVVSNNDITIKITATSRYNKNGKTVYKTFTDTQIYSNNQMVVFDMLFDAFGINPEIGNYPEQVEMVIYPYNKRPYKWVYNYGGAA